MTFKQTITWHTADEKPDRKRYIIFIDKEDAYPTPITGYYLGNGDIRISNGLPGLDKLTWDRVLCWTELSDFLYQLDSQCRR